MIYWIGIIVSLISLVFIIGFLLPAERVVSRKSHVDISPEILYKIVTNNSDWQYSKSLKDLIILENKEGIEIWDEISHDGTIIRFTTKEKQPFSFYSFDMDSKLFSGYWTGEFESGDKDGTIFTATEYIKVKNPFVKTLSYLFFDIGKLMDEYQEDLHKKVMTCSN
mgnify:CR=1 FL=1